MTNSLKKCIAICACVKIDLAFQLCLTLYCITNIGAKNGLEHGQLTDGPFGSMKARTHFMDKKKQPKKGCYYFKISPNVIL